MRKWVFVLVMVIMACGSVRPAIAAPPPNCLANFVQCQYEAAQQSNFWWRTISGLDCEINLWGCLKDTLLF